MRKLQVISILCCTSFLLTGCFAGDLTVYNADESLADSEEIVETASEETEASAESINISPTESLPERNNSPKIGEEFFAYPYVESGVLYATITGAEYYTNIKDLDLDEQCFFSDIQSLQRDPEYRVYDAETGEVLRETGVDTDRVFVLVHVTMRNVNATSYWSSMEEGLRGLNPTLYANGYCDAYDFRADDWGIGVQKTSGAYDISNTTGQGVDYFSLAGQHYADEQRKFFYHLEEGEEVSFSIGKFMHTTIANEDMAEAYGGAIGDNLVSRYCVVSTSSPMNPIIPLEFE